MVVVAVLPKVVGDLVDAMRQQRNLDFRRAGIFRSPLEIRQDPFFPRLVQLPRYLGPDCMHDFLFRGIIAQGTDAANGEGEPGPVASASGFAQKGGK